MSQVHLFDVGKLQWADHPRFTGLKIKGLEGRETHPHLSFMLVRVEVGGVIPRHVHDIETETAYVVSGHANLLLDVDEQGNARAVVTWVPGRGASIPPGLHHSVVNTGDEPLEILAIHSPPVR